MSMLERIKKKQWDGFKDFVESMEVTSAGPRSYILLNGILEDPRFMSWVTKNLRSFRDFLELPSDEIEQVVATNESMVKVVAKALERTDAESLQQYAAVFPKVFGKLRDEAALLQQVSPTERESAQFFLLKTARKLQRQESIQGFRWQLPPPEMFLEKPPSKNGVVQIFFDAGNLAAEGELLKGKRIGKWHHFYDNGKLLAEGEYLAGLKTGPWSFYFGNGQPRSQGKFKEDVRQGEWLEWDRAGHSVVVTWKDGKKVETP
jgi:hypothetical protein